MEKLFSATGHTKEQIFDDWRAQTEKDIKSRLLVESLLKARNITVTPGEIQQEYERIAEDAGVSAEEIQKHYADAKLKEYFIDEVKEQKLYTQLFDQVKTEKGSSMSFADLFKN